MKTTQNLEVPSINVALFLQFNSNGMQQHISTTETEAGAAVYQL